MNFLALDIAWLCIVSHIPRSSQCPVFDHLQYAKSEGGRPGPFYDVNDVSVYLGRQRGKGSPIERTSLRPFLVVSVPSTGALNIC